MIIKNIIDWYLFSIGALGILVLLGFYFNTIIKGIRTGKIFALLIFIACTCLFYFDLTVQILFWATAVSMTFTVIGNLSLTLRGLIRNKTIEGEITHFPTVSILIPAKNEQEVIGETLDAFSMLDYPKDKFDIIVIDDCSTDFTPEMLSIKSKIIPNLKIIKNSSSKGKSKALNDIIRTSDSEYVMIFDADHVVEPDMLKKVLVYFKDEKTACVQIKNSVRNGRLNLLTGLIDIEYVQRYEQLYRGRRQTSFLGSGGIFKTEILKKVGGFSEEMLTEDVELSMRLYENGYNILQADNVASHELACIDVKSFLKQRHRWSRGTWQAGTRHFWKIFASKIPFKTKIHFLLLLADNISLTSYLFLHVFFALNFTGLYITPVSWFQYGELIISSVVLQLMFLRSDKKYLSNIFGIFPYYYMIYAYTNFVAIADNMLFRTPYKWNKTDRMAIREKKKQLETITE